MVNFQSKSYCLLAVWIENDCFLYKTPYPMNSVILSITLYYSWFDPRCKSFDYERKEADVKKNPLQSQICRKITNRSWLKVDKSWPFFQTIYDYDEFFYNRIIKLTEFVSFVQFSKIATTNRHRNLHLDASSGSSSMIDSYLYNEFM